MNQQIEALAQLKEKSYFTIALKVWNAFNKRILGLINILQAIKYCERIGNTCYVQGLEDLILFI